jgi:non-canonical (house-cleaning) NTP pyrophosphatase
MMRGALLYGRLMYGGGFDKRLARRDMPSYRWARENAANLEAISRVTEAEQALSEAVDLRSDRQWSTVEEFKESAENNVRTALHNLAGVYLECGVAENQATADSYAGRALGVISRRIRTNASSSPFVSR